MRNSGIPAEFRGIPRRNAECGMKDKDTILQKIMIRYNDKVKCGIAEFRRYSAAERGMRNEGYKLTEDDNKKYDKVKCGIAEYRQN